MTKNKDSIKITFSSTRQLISFAVLVITFTVIFRDLVLVAISSLVIYYFIANFFIINFEITKSEIIIKYPYRLFIRERRFDLNSIQLLQLYKNTGGIFNSPTLKVRHEIAGKNQKITLSFLKPSKDDFEKLKSSLEKRVVHFEYHEHY